jgi:hypothetical protein
MRMQNCLDRTPSACRRTLENGGGNLVGRSKKRPQEGVFAFCLAERESALKSYQQIPLGIKSSLFKGTAQEAVVF